MARSDAEKARQFAKAAGDRQWEARIVGLHGLILYWGPTPLAEVEHHSREAVDFARRTRMRALEAEALRVLARVAAMRGRFEEARQLVRSANAITEQLGALLTHAADCISEALIEQLDGQLDAAEETLRKGDAELERMGGIGPRATVVGMLARVLLLKGQLDAAKEMTQVCERMAPAHQLDPQVKWRAIRAVVLAHRGQLVQAEALARDAVELADGSDQVVSRAEAREDLAEVLRAGRRHKEASHELELASWLYKEKGGEIAERNARRQLERFTR